MAMALLHIFTLVHLFTALLRTHAYIPALPTNSTQSAIDGGLNVTDVSKIRLQWYSNGYAIICHSQRQKRSGLSYVSSYAENVSYQLVGNNSNGISQVRASLVIPLTSTNYSSYTGRAGSLFGRHRRPQPDK
jgi:hypothetical protein